MDSERIGVFLPCLHQPSLEASLQKAADLGIRLIQPNKLAEGKLATNDWKQFLKLVRKHKVTVSGLSCYLNFGSANGIEDRIEIMKSYLDVAPDIPTPVVITEAGGIPFAGGGLRRQCWQTLVAAMKKVSDYAAKAGSYVAMEPGGGGLVASVESMHELLDEVNNPHLKLNMDPANVTMFGSDAVRAARDLGQHAIHTHAKDGVFHFMIAPEDFVRVAGKWKTLEELGKLLGHDTAPAEEVPLGKGQVQWKTYIAALTDAGYSGPFVIEREVGENPVADIVHAKKFLEAI